MPFSRIKHIIIFWITILFILHDGFAQSSILSDGSWHRIDVRNDGIYRIRYEDLVSRGVLQNPVPSSRIALFGGPNGALPLPNRSGETFDLQEIAILVVDNGSGTFGTGSYILFYGQSPSSWNWNSTQRKYTFHMNVFTDVMAYFLTTDYLVGTRKRLANKPIETSPTITITEFLDHYRYEKDDVNPFKSSQEWYGERLDPARPNLTIDLNLPGLVTSKPVIINARLVINEPARVAISNGNNPTRTLSYGSTINDWMVELKDEFSWTFTNATPGISFAYTRLSNNTSWAYLDYLELHYRRQLSFVGNAPFQFRFVDNETEIGKFIIGSANSTSQFWDISNPLEPQIVQGTPEGNTFSFTSSLVGRPEFIGFSENSVTSITQFEPIQNQNFHGVDSVEYVIVVHPLFRSEAERLAEFHRNRNLNVLVVTPTEVFNEFSFGRQYPMGIRRMMRHYRN
ncbi:MAG: C25 family cysteine peptidase, partial [Bacteroidales bacterium]|nr:C25 family cysteine peptidase [Bacteroidales bacterium]